MVVLFGRGERFAHCCHPIINLKDLFSYRPSDRAQILHACADRDENGSHLKKLHPPQSNTKPIRIEGRSSDGQISYAHASLRIAFGGNVTVSTSTLRHYDESVYRIKQLTRGNHTIGISDILSRIRNTTTTGSSVRVVYRGPFMSEDRSFDLSTVLNCTISCYRVLCTGSTPGKSVRTNLARMCR